MALQDKLMSAVQQRKSDIPVYVVPDKPGGQRQQYDTPTQKSGWQDYTQQTLDSISQYREKNPVNIPFAPGTKTMGQKNLDESKRQFDETMAYNLRKATSGGGGGGGGGGGSAAAKLSKNQRVGYVLKGAISAYNELMNSNQGVKDITLNGISYPMKNNNYTPEKAAQEIIGQIYNNLGGADLSVSDASNVVEAFTKAIGLQTGETQTPKQQLENFLSQKEMDYYKENPDDLKDRFGR